MIKSIQLFSKRALFLLLAFSCSPEKVDTSLVADEIKSRRIRKISASRIIEETQTKGNLILNCFAKDSSLLKKTSSKDSLEYIYACKIALWNGDTATWENSGKDYLYQVWDAYQYNIENQIALDENVQIFPERYILYTRPLNLLSKKNLLLWVVLFDKKELIKNIK